MNSTRDGDRKHDHFSRGSVDVNMINEKQVLEIKQLFNDLGVNVKRFIDHGMAVGLYAELCTPERNGNICYVEIEPNCINASVLFTEDGIVESLQNSTVLQSSENTYETIMKFIHTASDE